jgi:hypothetical protein
MPQPPQSEINRLKRFYEQSTRKLVQKLRDNLNLDSLGRARLLVLMQQSFNILKELDGFTERWAKRNIVKIYNKTFQEMRRELKGLGISRSLESVKKYAMLNRSAVESLLIDPQIGFVSSLRNATDEIRDRLKSIRSQATILRNQQRAFDETIARVGILEGQPINEVRDQIVNEILNLKKSSEMVFGRKAAKLGPGNIISNVANLPYIKIETRNGIRMVRVDDYAELLARTKTKQATNLARRHSLLQHGERLVRISPNKPLIDDACWLYVGKVFALTEDAMNEYKVPHVKELPSGGCPFHPNCTHDERAFIPEFRTDEEKQLGYENPPEWALNTSWPDVQREFKARGGVASIEEYNRAAVKFAKTTGGRKRRRRKS